MPRWNVLFFSSSGLLDLGVLVTFGRSIGRGGVSVGRAHYDWEFQVLLGNLLLHI